MLKESKFLNLGDSLLTNMTHTHDRFLKIKHFFWGQNNLTDGAASELSDTCLEKGAPENSV